ncbi:phosphoserine phosphatase SerB [Methylocystis sp.]|uniref:phosphoserine phosphatase SerB n=1 Tax=Methylocystis sp. TaxID=1911079 RepID=UPI0025D37E69|nr:phosphoserine phosphatase SerB [Methylocystis sp.]
MSKPIDYVATFVAGRGAGLNERAVSSALFDAGLIDAGRDWLAPDLAVDALLSGAGHDLADLRARLQAAVSDDPIDVIVQPSTGRRKQLLVADMDSTMIGQECVDELADLVGLREHVAAITERAMRGEVDFESALKERVALLAGVTLAQIETLLARITLTPGARQLVQTMRAHGAHTALVSGGFTQFTEPVAARIGFHETRANLLQFADGALTGAVVAPVLGREAKRAVLVELREACALPRDATLAIGDGANDLDMLREAGLGVAFHAKPTVAQAADARIAHGDLTAALYAQGFRREEFVE